MKNEANVVADNITPVNTNALSLPIRTDDSSRIKCPFCGSPTLMYRGAIIVQHTADEGYNGDVHPVEIAIDAYDGDVKVIGLSKEDAIDETSRIGIKLDCPKCRKIKPYILCMQEDDGVLGASMEWLNIENA